MRILIVDDEAPARRRLRRQLQKLGHSNIVGEASDGNQACAVIGELRPELVFLDINLPHLNGLGVVAKSSSMPAVVFVTAFDEFAIRAFDIGAVDYLLKPVSIERLSLALERAAAALGKLPQAATGDVVAALSQRDAIPADARIACREHGRLRIFDARDIGRFWSSEKYTLFFADSAEQMTDEPLSTLEERLESFQFMRIHRAELVNLLLVRGLVRQAGSTFVELVGGQRAAIGRRRVASVKARLAALGSQD